MFNCAGDAAYTDAYGRLWQPDNNYYCPGSYGYFDTYAMYNIYEPVNGTYAGDVYANVTEDYEIEYRFDVPTAIMK